MAKDPAILFYTSDFLTGTLLFTNEEAGMYIRLLCLHHQKGRLTKKDMLNICKRYVEHVFSKFIIDESGMYYNERLEEETLKRKNYSKSRSENRKKKKDVKNISKSYVQHMENENILYNYNLFKEEFELQNFEIIMMKLSIEKDDFEKLKNEFLEIIQLTEEFKEKSKFEIQNHFINWLKKNKPKSTKENETKIPDFFAGTKYAGKNTPAGN